MIKKSVFSHVSMWIIFICSIGSSADTGTAPIPDKSILHVNNIVGDTIDAAEARYYRIFSDVSGFEYATFHDYRRAGVEKPDSISGPIVARIMRQDAAGSAADGESTMIRIEKHVRIDRDVFQSLRNYILFFKEIVTDDSLRKIFIKNHEIEWPLVTDAEMESAEIYCGNLRKSSTNRTVSCLGASGAYAGSIIGREINEVGCGIYEYSVDPRWVCGLTAAGVSAGYLLNRAFYSGNPKSEALKHGVAAFDDNNLPITERDIESVITPGQDCLSHGCSTAGILGAIATGIGLSLPWGLFMQGLLEPETDIDLFLALSPVIAVTCTELVLIFKKIEDAEKIRNRKATIEKIKKMREQERLKR